MKVTSILILLFLPLVLLAQDKSVCAVKIGGGTFINMKHIIVFQETDVCDIASRNDSIIVNMQFYDQNGKILAKVVNSKIADKSNVYFDLKYSNTEFTLVSKETKQLVCLVKRGYNSLLSRCELQVWMDTYLPNGFYMKCTPDENYSPQLQNLIFKGATMTNGNSAIVID